MKKNNANIASALLASIRNRHNRPAELLPYHRPAGSLLFASYNVHKCVGVDGRFDPGRTIEVIHEIDPDVIALQEADMRFGERAGLLDLPRLRQETGLAPIPVTVAAKPKSHGWRGNVLLFKQGVLRDVHQVALPGLEPRGALVAEIDLDNGKALRVIAAHLGLMRRSRRQQADTLVDIIGMREDCPTVLMGDFNEWRLGNGSSLKRLERVFGPLPPALPSFPAQLPVLSLDRIMANREGLIQEIAVHDSPLARLASDHLPIKARIDLGTAVEA
ncbi:endonuclease/exonuclease/phosphatase family protein [Rhizobium sp. RU36D]|uniref:endonuclease/exonuclease/phosphatase family protein n=1 Tax=Rhizobium sp. RU36D TaxID=1907415 RepID=UPI0009D7B408|nr:endonuclease/exonuclease/phosphatase family protein [Rhizobium sp. RU36D]SMC59081.1 Metal-dependent hydrolase, endonuclease/exonuclease/phosphatase family [Rhizobium sp. RU36D]